MAEDRFSTEEENMADFMAMKLPRWDALDIFEDFYQDAWHWCLNHGELMELFPQIPESQFAFQRCLQICAAENRPDLFAVALALRREELRR